MNLLIITQLKQDSTSFYRAAGVVRNLRQNFKGLNVNIIDESQVRMTWADLLRFDCILFQRPFKHWAVGMIQMAKRLKIPVWVDYDDNLLSVPREIPKIYDIYSDSNTQEAIKGCLALADVVTVSTDRLKKEFIQFNKNTIVVKNAIDLDIMGGRSQKDRAQIMGWRGSSTHSSDLILFNNEISKAFTASDWNWCFMGYDNIFLGGERYHYVKPSDPFIYFNTLQQLNLSCLHVPLIDNLFNRCKSNIAAIEGTWAGAVCIVPDWQEWDIPGTLKYKTLDGYYKALTSVMSGEIDIQENNSLAWEYISDELSLEKQNRKRIDILNNL